MFAMEIVTNIGCKNNCIYCPQDRLMTTYARRSNVFSMGFDIFKACLDKIPLEVEIHFSGLGEPWLNPECTRMLLYTHKRGHKISVFTSLVGMGLSDIDLIELVPFKYFYVHLPSDQGYEKIAVDENYLKLLNKLHKSKIKAIYQFHGESIHFKLKSIIKNNIVNCPLNTRAGNIKIKDRPPQIKKRGIIRCERNLFQNMLLPNGDVLLCCMDAGMKHVIGNLLFSDYDALFLSEEFLKVKKGLRDESLDVLCRYCEISYDISLFAKICNFYFSRIKNNLRIGKLLNFTKKLF